MRFICCYLLLIVLAINTFGQSVVKTNCAKYPINERDSVCLDTHVNIAPEEVERAIKSGEKDVLLIFDGWDYWNKRLLTVNNLQNPLITDYLKRYRIITLYVDDRVVVSAEDSMTVGKRNALYEMDRFQAATQPYYIIIKGGKAKCSAGYMPSHEKILAFFKRCE